VLLVAAHVSDGGFKLRRSGGSRRDHGPRRQQHGGCLSPGGAGRTAVACHGGGSFVAVCQPTVAFHPPFRAIRLPIHSATGTATALPSARHLAESLRPAVQLSGNP